MSWDSSEMGNAVIGRGMTALVKSNAFYVVGFIFAFAAFECSESRQFAKLFMKDCLASRIAKIQCHTSFVAVDALEEQA